MLEFAIKLKIRLLNILGIVNIHPPAWLLDRTMRFIWNHPLIITPILSTIRPKELEKIAQKLVVYRFRKIAPLTPALVEFYKDIDISKIKNLKKFEALPKIDKDNYVKKYPIEYRCLYGQLPKCGTLFESAGTSGKSTIWASSREEELFFEKYVKFGLNYVFKTDFQDFKIINCWAFGMWPTAIDFSKASNKIGQVVNVGTNMDKTLELLSSLGKNYRYIITGYPPFLSHLFQEGKRRDFNWNEWYIHILSGGEGFVEEWRENLKKYLGPKSLVYSALGSTDLGLSQGMENFFTVAIRQIMHIYQTFLDDPEKSKELSKKYFPKIDFKDLLPKNKESARELFMRIFKNDPVSDRRLPMLFQYDPTFYYNEEVMSEYENGRKTIELVTTVLREKTAIPRVRYNIKDECGIIKFDEMEKALKNCGVNIKDVVESLEFESDNILHLPFIYIYGRSDGTISIDGSNIFPSDVEELLADDKNFDDISSFIMEVTQNHTLGFSFELKRDTERKDDCENNIKELFKKLLPKYSSGYADILKEELVSSNLEIKFFPFGTGPFEAGPLSPEGAIKYKRIKKIIK